MPEVGREIIDEQAMVRVLASLGAQTSGFVHEINGLLRLANAVEKALTGIRDELERTDAKRAARVKRVLSQVSELSHTLQRQAAYLTEIVTPDKRRRRSRQELSARFDAALKLLIPYAEKNDIEIKNQIPSDLRSPPMFAAEVVSVFTNLLSNAIKAAGRGGADRGEWPRTLWRNSASAAGEHRQARCSA